MKYLSIVMVLLFGFGMAANADPCQTKPNGDYICGAGTHTKQDGDVVAKSETILTGTNFQANLVSDGAATVQNNSNFSGDGIQLHAMAAISVVNNSHVRSIKAHGHASVQNHSSVQYLSFKTPTGCLDLENGSTITNLFGEANVCVYEAGTGNSIDTVESGLNQLPWDGQNQTCKQACGAHPA